MPGMTDAWLLPLFPAGAFVILVLAGKYLPRKGDFVAIAGIALSFLLVFPILKDLTGALAEHGVEEFSGVSNSVQWFEVPGNLEIRFGIFVDPITAVMLVVVTFVALMVQVYSLGYMKGEPRYGWFYAVLSLFAASMLSLVLADNFLLLYFSWELVGICSFLLIGFYSDRRSAAEAAKKAFITTRIGDVGLLTGIIILFRETGTFDIQQVFHLVEAGEVNDTWLTAAVVLLFMGAVGKSAQFPLHVWLPDAMEGPTPVSALIHAATMVVAGVYLVARALPLFETVHGAPELVTSIGLVTVVLSALIGLTQRDIKRVIAYSTINSLGLMFVALGLGSPTAAMLYLFTHGFFKALLFLGSGSVIHATERQEVDGLGGLARKMPITTWTFLIGTLAMAGLIPFSGYWAKDEILVAAKGEWNQLLLAALVATLPVTAMYMARLFILTFLGEPRDRHAFEHAHESPPSMSVPLIVLGALAAVSGFVVFDTVGEALGFPGGFGKFVFFEHPHEYEFDAAITLVSVLTVGGGLVAAWFIWTGEQRPAKELARLFPQAYQASYRKFYFDEIYQWAIDHVVLAVGRVMAWFDRVIVNDTGVNGTAEATGLAGWLLKFQQTGKLPNYALAIVVGVVTLAIIGLAMRT
jgi:NADH-quinone oxidoreductase subunit L